MNTRTYWHFFRAWVGIGIQSFGGGATTLFLMRQLTVERQQWLSDAEFSRYWGIVQIAPGINLLGQTVLIGHRVRGIRGAFVALAGLLLPSTAITVIITALYSIVRQHPAVIAVLRGIVPATVGIGGILALQMMRPPLISSKSEGWRILLASICLLVCVPLGAIVTGWPSIVMLWGGAGVYALVYWWLHRTRKKS